MAVFHFTARVVSRSKGQSAVHKAAYNARTQLHDDRHGRVTKNYENEGELLFSGIFTPKNAPAWTQDREQLWNRAEAAEKRKDAQTAREVEIALPHELTDQQREWLVKDFVREQFVRKGMIADVAIHAPDPEGDERNYHAHILLTTRGLEGEAFGKKNREWNSKAQLQEWREAWAKTANRYLERFGHEERIDHRTLEAQGIDREPTLHLGPNAAAMEARGIETERGEQLRAIEERNRERVAIEIELKNELLQSGIVLVDIGPEERATAREAHEQALGDYAEHNYNARRTAIAKGPESQKDLGREIERTAERGAKAFVAVADKAVDAAAELLDLLAGSTNKPTYTAAQLRRMEQERTATQQQQSLKPERVADIKPEPKHEETPAELRRRLREETEALLAKDRQLDLTEDHTRRRRRGR